MTKLKQSSIIRWLIIFTLLSTLSIFQACTKKDGDVIKIGVITVETGDGANYGLVAKQGIELAIEELNVEGGINGKKILSVYADSKGNPRDAVSAYRSLQSQGITLILGPFYSSNFLAIAPLAAKDKVVLLTGSATDDNITNAGKYSFRVCPTNLKQGETLANFAIFELHAKTVYVLYRNVDYGISLKKSFVETFLNNGGEIYGEEGIEPDANDVRTQLTKASEKAADVIFAPIHYPEGGVLLKQAKELGVKSIIIGGDGGFDPKLIEIAGNASENSFWSTIGLGGSDVDSIRESYLKNYKDKYGIESGAYSALYYDAMRVASLALQSSKDYSGESIREALMNIQDYRGPTGITKFDENGDVDKPFSIYKVQEGEFKLVR